MRRTTMAAGLAAAMLAAGCADGPENTLAADPVADGQAGADTLTGIGEAGDPLGDMDGGGDVPGTEM